MPDFASVAKIALNNSLSICHELFPLGQKRGCEYVVGDVYGNKGESLSINLVTGIWKDFASDKGGGDITSLIAMAKGISQSEAAEWIEGKYHFRTQDKRQPEKNSIEDSFTPVLHLKEYAPDSALNHPTLGVPSSVYWYHDNNGDVLNAVCRFDVNGKKEFRALTYGTLVNQKNPKGRTAWHWKQLPSPRPLYNLDLLPEGGEIVIVEGEKTADKLKELLPDLHVTTWQAGVENALNADWSPIASKKYAVLIWPDNDAEGHKAADRIAFLLHDKVASVQLIDTSSLPEKSDAADWNKSVYELRNFLLEKRKAYKIPEPEFKPISGDASTEENGGFDAMQLPGIIGETIRWIAKHSIFPQPELAMLCTLSFAGSVFGRRWIGPTGTYTNVYTIGIAGTGQGKERAPQMITNLAAASGLSQFIGGNSIRSDTGMVRGLSNNACQLLMLDEFGMWLKGISNPQAPSFIRDVIRTILTLYGKSGGVYNHGDYADAKAKPIVIHHPVLCIYGTTTESEYIPCLKKSAISSGQMGRFIAISGRNNVDPVHDAPIYSMDEDLADKWRQFKPDTLSGIVNNDTVVPTPAIVSIGKCENIKRQLLDMQTKKVTEKSETAELWVRYWENILRIAAIFAVARNHENPVHTQDDFDIAKSIVEMSINYMSDLVANNMAETTHESQHHEMLKFIRKHPGGITRFELLRKFRKFTSRDIEELVKGMIEQELIELIQDNSTGGRKRTIYRPLSPS